MGPFRGLRHTNRASRGAVLLALVSSLVSGMAGVPAASAAGGGGNASIILTKSVAAVTLTPRLALTLAVDRSTAIPGDVLAYTASLSNTGSTMGLTGEIDAANNGDTTATVAAWYDFVEYFSVSSNGWLPLAGAAAAQSGYVPLESPPIATGLDLAATGHPAAGVAYPATGDHILGTTIDRHATGAWTYTASLALTPDQVDLLLDPAQVTKIRNVVHLEVTPRPVKNGQPFLYRADFITSLQALDGAATDATITITLPSGDQAVFNATSTPALARLAPADDVSVEASYVVPVPDAKGASESDADYLARLAALDGRTLTVTANAMATGGGTTLTAPVASAETTEQLPIVSIAKTGPDTVDAGETAHYDLALANRGSATASHLAISDALPGGDTGTVSDVPASLDPGATATAHAAYDVPASQPEGDLTDTASITWADGNANPYGPVSDAFTTQVRNSLEGAHLTLTPETAGPLVVGTSHTLTVTATNAAGDPIAGLGVTLAIEGPNAATTSLTTDAAGNASFTYVGAAEGTDTAQATATRGATTIQSNTAQATWLAPVNPVSTIEILARYFASDGSGQFHATPGQTPAFSQYVPTINFNPPAGTVPGNTSGVGVNTRPFTDITTDLAGNFTGRIVAEGNGLQAGVGGLNTFNAVYTSEFTVAAAGDITFDFYSDDGFIFGIGNGATRVSGALRNPPASGLTPFEAYPVVGSYNDPTSPVANSVTVHFPAAGSYPYELDYSECCGGQLVLTMATHASGHGVPPSGSLSLTPFTIAARTVGQTQTMTLAAMDAAGIALADLPVTLTITGPNDGQLTSTTDAAGIATFSYTGQAAGTDQLQVGAIVSGSPTISNIVSLTWTAPPTPAPEIGDVGPVDGTTVTEPVPITATFTPPAGQTIASWSVTYQRVGTVGSTTLAAGTGVPPATLATFDPTVLVNGTYTLTISATASGGGIQSTTTNLVVDGNLKLGRYTTTYQDLSVPVAGLPIQVLRSYDSFDKSVGDFGVGWRVEVANFRVSTGRPLGAGGWTQYNIQCFFGLCLTGFHSSVAHVATVTWPDGHQELFDFTPGGGSNIFWTGTAAFTGRPGTTSNLVADGDNAVSYVGDGNLYAGFLGSSTIFNPQRYRLTAKDGTVYLLDRTTGLVSATDRNGNTLTVAANGVTSSSGPSISFTRDGLGRITAIRGPAGETLGYGYSATGDLATFTDAAGHAISYTYDGQHNLLSTSDPDGHPIRTVTYENGRVASVSDGSGQTVELAPSVADRQQVITDPNGALTTVYSYDADGNTTRVDRVFDGQTLTTTMAYDSLGRLISQRDPDGLSSTFEWDAKGNVTSLTDRSGKKTTYTYNGYGRVASITDDGAQVVHVDYDTHGNALTVTRAAGPPSTYTYSAKGQLTSIHDAAGRIEGIGYDANGFPSLLTDPSGHQTHLTNDAAGRVLSVLDASGTTSSFAYDGNGNLLSISDGNHHARSFSYDFRGNRLTQTDALGAVASYSYDAAGHVTSYVDRAGRETDFGYDIDGHLTSRTLPGGDVTTFTYDPLGRLIGAENATRQITLRRDSLGRLVSETDSGTSAAPLPTVEITSAYDADSRRISSTGPDGAIGYAYDGQSRLSTVTDQSGDPFTFTYDPASRLVAITRPNGISDAFAYDASDTLLSRTASLDGTVISATAYTYDSNGQRATASDASGVTSYTHDLIGQLTGADYPAGPFSSQTFAYDGAGNRTSGGSAYDDGNRLTGNARYAYAYDAEGELVARTDVATSATTTYSWNAAHQLTAVHRPDGSTTTYGYDPFGRRVRIDQDGAVTSYVYDGNRIRLEYDGTAQLAASYTFGSTDDSVLEMNRGGQRYYYVDDGQGSTVALTDQSGGVAASYAYDAFGNQASTGAVRNPFTFQGREYDPATGFYYFRARYYDPGTGRFISEDPLQGPNQYAFGASDPVDFGDPSGLSDSVEYGLLLDTSTAEATELGAAVDLVEAGVPTAASEADIAGLNAKFGFDVAKQFSGPISKMVLERDLLAFRFFGEGFSAIGRWLTTLGTALRIGSFGQPAIDALNLLVSGNPATSLAPLLLPEGTTIFFGEVAGGSLPGAVQILIETAEGVIPLFP